MRTDFTIWLALLLTGALGMASLGAQPGKSRKALPGPRVEVESIAYLTHGSGVAYSRKLNKLAFQRFNLAIQGEDGTGTNQIWVSDANGSGARCITCRNIPHGPRLNQHKGSPSWHPSGKWLVVAVEMPRHQGKHADAQPGFGSWNDLWAVAPDGSRWVQLTHYAASARKSPFPAPIGALIPRFANRKSRLAWAEMIGFDARHPMGIWRLATADFVDDGRHPPRLANIQRTRPGNETFYEPWSFSPDDTRITIASDINQLTPAQMDIMVWEPATGKYRNLTRTFFHYEEQAIFSPDGQKIAYMSTQGQTPRYNIRQFMQTLRTDVWIMHADGSGKQRLTYFNDPGHREYFKGVSSQKLGIPVSWGPDSKTLYIDVGQLQPGRNNMSGEAARIYRLQLK